LEGKELGKGCRGRRLMKFLSWYRGQAAQLGAFRKVIRKELVQCRRFHVRHGRVMVCLRDKVLPER
jgi:hypothetical protein